MSLPGTPTVSFSIDTLEKSFEVLALWGGVFAAPTPRGAVKAAFRTRDTFNALTKPQKASVRTLARSMAAAAGRELENLPVRDLPADAEQLYAQMLEASAPKAAALVDHALDARRIAERMHETLTDREHLVEPMRALFIDVTTAALETVLHDKDFLNDIRPLIDARLLQGQDETNAVLGRLSQENADIQTILLDIQEGLRARPREATDETRRFLSTLAKTLHLTVGEDEAEDVLRYRIMARTGELLNIEDSLSKLPPDLAGISVKVREALAAFDLDRAQGILDEAIAGFDAEQRPQIETWIGLNTKKAELSLIRGDHALAYRLFERCAAEAEKLGLQAMLDQRLSYLGTLHQHALRLDPNLHDYAIRICDPIIEFHADDFSRGTICSIMELRADFARTAFSALGWNKGKHFLDRAFSDEADLKDILADVEDTEWAAHLAALGGRNHLAAAELLMGDDADPHLEASDSLLAEALRHFELLDDTRETALVKLDIAQLRDRQSERAGQGDAIAMLTESEKLLNEAGAALLAATDINAMSQGQFHDLMRTTYLSARIYWALWTYHYGPAGEHYLSDAVDRLEFLMEFAPEKADPIGLSRYKLLHAEVQVDLATYVRGENLVAELLQAREAAEFALGLARSCGFRVLSKSADRTVGQITYLIDTERAS